MRRKNKKLLRVIAAAAGLGVVAGLRSMAAPAVLSWAANHGAIGRLPRPLRLLRNRRAEEVTAVMALGEIIADKVPNAPNRTTAPAVAARMASGALVGGTLCASKRKPLAFGVIAGALGALAGTYAGFHLRRRLSQQLPDTVVAVAEDAIALGSGALLARVA
jgi:uncharacterized membrane protein